MMGQFQDRGGEIRLAAHDPRDRFVLDVSGEDQFRVVAEDRRGDKTPVSKKTVLKLEGDKAALVTLSGSAGFKAEWDGMGDYDVGKMPAGRYRTFVTPVSTGQKIRGATFEIEEGKTCTFTFQVSKENWEGSCK